LRRIFTIGHSNRSADEFVKLLKEFGIRAVIDVRRFPTSKHEHFKRERLQEILCEHGIKYFYLGDKLGGFRSGGYRSFMKTEEFLSGLEELERIAKKEVAAIMCAERFPWRCHRRFISMALEERGWEVLHIIDNDRIWRPKRRRELEDLSNRGE